MPPRAVPRVRACPPAARVPRRVAASGAWHDASSTGSAPQPPSCQTPGPGRTNCGDGSESCCTSLEVTGGTFDRTYFNSGTGPSQTGDPATVSGFRFDKYLVTVGRFREFVAAWTGGWVPPAGSGKHTHLNAGRGLVDVGEEAGVAYEPGWRASDDANLAPTTTNLTTSCNQQVWATWSASPVSLASWRSLLPQSIESSATRY